jgi:hypothetical protein
MNALITNCPRCDALFRMPIEALLVTAGTPDDEPGRVAYVCLSCFDLVDEPLPAQLSRALVSAGYELIDAQGAE